MEKSVKSPWLWVPSLYFAEGVPYFLVNNISVMMFAKMGVPNGQMAFFTTLLYFPWFLKGLWSPIVDVIKTKRWWILTMQVLMTAMMILLTVTLPKPSPEAIAEGAVPINLFWVTLVLFIVAAFASATHDIAADGYYMLAHSPSSQAAFIGIRSTAYRIASVFGQGVLVFIAGRIEKSTGDIPFSWQVTIGVSAIEIFCAWSGNNFLAIAAHAGQHDVAIYGIFSGTSLRKSLASSIAQRSAPIATSNESAKPSALNNDLILPGTTEVPN